MRSYQILIGRLLMFVLLIAGIGGCSIDPLHDPNNNASYLNDDVYYCSVHDKPLRVGIVRIEYGLPFSAISKPYREIAIVNFPNARECMNGGCVIYSDMTSYARVWYCSTCRAARSAWEKNMSADDWRRMVERESRLESIGLSKEWKPGEPEKVAEIALRQTDDELIELCLTRLRWEIGVARSDKSMERAIKEYVRVVKRLEEGWPGFSGEIVEVRGTQKRQRTTHEMLGREYGLAAVEIGFRNSPVQKEVLARIEPDPGRRELHDLWLKSQMITMGQ